MDTGLQQGLRLLRLRGLRLLRLRSLRLQKIEKSSASEEVLGRRGLRLLKTEIGTILANGVDQVGILGFRLRSLSLIRFERYSPSLSSSADLRLHRTFV
ncbi:hypothetical protein L6452_28244 [Arctium lappa]|uniref:Uncharacterized protein n=1 Tax=Arctium lappa TaxID=4217 RepID=A0ACB8ZYX3_ARCLA|nr:hypothetical protein L6452_28244 [Arctium lappa]